MEFEAPSALLTRLKLGREEFCQRLLTTLILRAPYPRWNTRSAPCSEGLAFLQSLYELTFDATWPGNEAVFVDEFELPARDDAERGAAPDYAVLWPDRVWMIELKTERGSHRRDQIPTYFELAHHHYPTALIDLLYVTPPMSAAYEPAAAWARYANVAWPDLLPLLRSAWADTTNAGQGQVLEGLIRTIETLEVNTADWRASWTGVLPTAKFASRTSPEPDVTENRDLLAQSLELAELTSRDGVQRAVGSSAIDLDGFLELRVAVRAELARSPDTSPLRHVLPWVWRWESKGQPLTPSGQEVGRELRLSRYATDRYKRP